MFVTKKNKHARLEKIAGMVETQHDLLMEKELADVLRVARKTNSEDLVALEERVTLLAEDAARGCPFSGEFLGNSQ